MESNWQQLQPAEVDMSHLPESLRQREVWKNDTYTVFVSRNIKFPGVPCGMTWLSIKRNDKEPCNDWRHFQWIKNQLCGPECEGVQLYPAERRMLDGSNQYHIWILENPKTEFPFGFNEGRNISRKPLENGKQRDWPANMLPADIEQSEQRVQEQLDKFNLK